MNILEKLFSGMADFKRFAPGVDSNNSLEDLRPAGASAKKRVDVLLTKKIADTIADCESDDIKDYLRMAIANLTCCQQLVFDAVNRRKQEVDVYRYELEKMQRTYMENYYNAMDSIIQQLNTSPEEGDTTSVNALWRNTRHYKLLASCHISTCEEFDTIFTIDLSYHFFFRTIPLQKECVDERLGAYFSRITENDENITNILKLALAKKTIAKALRRFDILEFPPTIRNLFEENTASRSGSDEHNQALTLADSLNSEADELLSNAEALLSDDDSSDFSTETSFNRPNDKIIMMP